MQRLAGMNWSFESLWSDPIVNPTSGTIVVTCTGIASSALAGCVADPGGRVIQPQSHGADPTGRTDSSAAMAASVKALINIGGAKDSQGALYFCPACGVILQEDSDDQRAHVHHA